MNTTIKTNSPMQFTQIRRFVKKNKIYNTITEENNLYIITLFGLNPKELEKFIKDFIKTNHLTKIQQQEPLALAA
jgi:ABC-type Na+ transport system ATPase subunit NatA